MPQAISLSYSRIEPALYRNFTKAIRNIGRKDRSWPWTWKFALWLALVFLLTWVMNLDVFHVAGRPPTFGAFALGVLVMLLGQYLAFWAIHRRLFSVYEQGQNQSGPTNVSLGPEGCRFESQVACTDLKWQAIEEVLDLKTGTGLRSGLYVYLLPNESLPAEISPDEFRERLEAWRQAA